MTDERSRPVMDNYRDFCNSPAIKTMEAEGFDDALQLLHDLAAVLRAGAEATGHAHCVPADYILRDWQVKARDPETGERVFP